MAFLYIHRVELPQTICSAGEAEQCQGPYYGSWDQPDLDLNPSSAAYCCVTLGESLNISEPLSLKPE